MTPGALRWWWAAVAMAGLLCLATGVARGGDAMAIVDDSESVVLARAAALVDAGSDSADARAQARALLDAVLAANPGSAGAHREYARIHIGDAYTSGTQHDPRGLEKAETALDRAVALAPRFAEARVLRGHLYTLLGRHADAHTELALAEEIGGASAWLHLNMGALHAAEGDHEAAFARCRRVRPEEQPVRIARAADDCVLRALGDLERNDEAEVVYLAALQRDPYYAWNHGNYATFLLCRRGTPLDAARYARDALQLEEYSRARVTLSAALYGDWARQSRSGDADAEADAWERALLESTFEPVSAMHHLCGGPATLDLMRALRDSGRSEPMPPMLAVLAAAEAGDDVVPGIFGFVVAATGSDAHGSVFLNSEEDYRDQRTFTVVLTKGVAEAWRALHREDPQALKGRRITVAGYVRRARIDFTAHGLPTGKFYYQTQLTVHEPWQVMVGAPPKPPAPRPGRDRI